MYICISILLYLCTNTHAHTYIYIYINLHTCTNTLIYIYLGPWIRGVPCSIYTYIYMYIYINMYTYIPICMGQFTCKANHLMRQIISDSITTLSLSVCKKVLLQMLTCIYMCTYVHTWIYTRTDICTRTHKYWVISRPS